MKHDASSRAGFCRPRAIRNTRSAGRDRQRAVTSSEYRRKRDPKQTPEPFGGQRARRSAPIFVVQRHDARRLHYDFRLERDGALASWAVPKGVPLEPGAARLAVHVEDHPLEYATFEGEIPKGQYGAGTVEIWDTRHVRARRGEDGRRPDRPAARQAARGTWTLVPAQLDGDPKNWLLLRSATRRRRRRRAASARYAADARDARRRALPRGEGWLYEVKWDGYRALARVAAARPSSARRNGQGLHRAVRGRRARSCRGRCARRTASSTARSARSTSTAARASRRCSRERRDADRLLRLRPARARRRAARRPAARRERRERLEALLDRRNRPSGSPRRSTTARRCYEAAKEQGLEGVDGEAGRLALPRGQAHARLAQGQDARPRRSS